MLRGNETGRREIVQETGAIRGRFWEKKVVKKE